MDTVVNVTAVSMSDTNQKLERRTTNTYQSIAIVIYAMPMMMMMMPTTTKTTTTMVAIINMAMVRRPRGHKL